MEVRRATLLFILLAAACGGTDVSGVDAGGGDGAIGAPDATSTPTTTLKVEFKAVPGVPGEVGGPFKVELTTVQLVLSDVRAIGDVAPGDETLRESLVLTWDKSEKETLAFQGAPPGLYSSLRAQVVSYQMTGTVELTEDVQTSFTITDTPSPSLSVLMPLSDGRLEPGQTKTVEVEVDLGYVLRELPWSDLYDGSDPIVIDGTKAIIDDIRDELTEAFGYDS